MLSHPSSSPRLKQLGRTPSVALVGRSLLALLLVIGDVRCRLAIDSSIRHCVRNRLKFRFRRCCYSGAYNDVGSYFFIVLLDYHILQ
jgi:hypothetical protein